jgi:predicted adenine nucleotide alpha hydrolase (AANH) superfamily ATPase
LFDKLKEKDVILFFLTIIFFLVKNGLKRLENARKVGEILILRFEEDYDQTMEKVYCWTRNEPEKGKRCLKCFLYNLRKAGEKAKEIGADYFTTTLSVSKYKAV